MESELLAELKTLHEALLGHVAELERVTSAATCDAAALASLRWRMGRASRLRTGLVETRIFPRLLAAATPANEAALRTLHAEIQDFCAKASRHVSHWTAERTRADWVGYRAASRANRELMRRRVDLEKRLLYPLLSAQHVTG